MCWVNKCTNKYMVWPIELKPHVTLKLVALDFWAFVLSNLSHRDGAGCDSSMLVRVPYRKYYNVREEKVHFFFLKSVQSH